jgi:hypothetical protein
MRDFCSGHLVGTIAISPSKPPVNPSYTPPIPLLFLIGGEYEGNTRGIGVVYRGFRWGYVADAAAIICG